MFCQVVTISGLYIVLLVRADSRISKSFIRNVLGPIATKRSVLNWRIHPATNEARQMLSYVAKGGYQYS